MSLSSGKKYIYILLTKIKNLHALLPAMLTLTLSLKSFFPNQTSEDESSQQSLVHQLGHALFPLCLHKSSLSLDLGCSINTAQFFNWFILLNGHLEVTKINLGLVVILNVKISKLTTTINQT